MMALAACAAVSVFSNVGGRYLSWPDASMMASMSKDGVLSLPAAISDAAAAPAPAGTKKSQTIVITGKSGGIVGQMARIPLQNTQITEVNSVSSVDNRKGRDLLTIISKY